jgi:hypothetical protein
MRQAEFHTQRHRRMPLAIVLIACIVGCAPAAADIEYQFHGYAAQGFVYTTENNFFGESSDGSTDYYEAGLNATVQVRPNLTFAAQVAIRDAGISDDGSLRLDYALADYRFFANVNSSAGLRIGKIKNAMGFYNETRDVVFTRPGVLLPSVYSDNQNQRSLVFTSPGAQVYGTRTLGRHELSLTGTANFDRNVRKSDERLLIDLGGLPFDLRIEDSWNAQIMDTLDGGMWQFGVSYFSGRFTLATPDPIGLAGKFDVSLTQFSARYNSERYSVTAEYVLNPNTNRVTSGGTEILRAHLEAERGYLQGEYRLTPQWGLMARLDAAFSDRHDRSGREFAAATGANRKSRQSRDMILGVNWRPDEHWGVWGEYHLIDGTASLQRAENPGGPSDDQWSLIMLMAAYKF